jgi:hypothetical protein
LISSGTTYEFHSYLCTAIITHTYMKHSPHLGYPLHSYLTSAQHKNTANKQMKESKTSERKKTHMSLIFHLFFLCLFLSMTACSDKSDYHFKNSSDALKQYRDFHHSIAAVPQTNAEQLADFICQWQELSDTVYNYIKKDPAFTAHVALSMDFHVTSDSVRNELLRLAMDCSLSDVAYVKMHTSPYRDDAELDLIKKKATTFFAALDKQPIYNQGNAREKVALYRNFLETTKQHGINNQKELLAFLETEDRHFRTFLSNIGEYTDVGLEDVTKMTEQICKDIFRAASQHRLSSEDAMVYMGMRTCRRLLLNAQVCADLLKKGKVNSEQQANAYMWMTLQPFLSMDSLSISLLTEAQQQQMTELAASFPKLSERLIDKGWVDPKHLAQIPTQLMRLYISWL